MAYSSSRYAHDTYSHYINEEISTLILGYVDYSTIRYKKTPCFPGGILRLVCTGFNGGVMNTMQSIEWPKTNDNMMQLTAGEFTERFKTFARRVIIVRLHDEIRIDPHIENIRLTGT